MSRVKKKLSILQNLQLQFDRKMKKKKKKLNCQKETNGKVFPVTRDKIALQASKFTAAI